MFKKLKDLLTVSAGLLIRGNTGPYSVTKVLDDPTVSRTSAGTDVFKTNLIGPHAVASLTLIVILAGLVARKK